MSYLGNDDDNTVTVTGPGNFGGYNGQGGTDTLILNLANVMGDIDTFNSGGAVTNHFDIDDPEYFGIGISNFERINITTGGGNDVLNLFSGDDVVSTGAGDDTINTQTGATIIDGGSGVDAWTANLGTTTANSFLDLSLTTTQAFHGGSVTSIERVQLILGSGNDTILTLTGAAGAGLLDNIVAGGGNDVIRVGGGTDSVNGGDGDDLLIVDYSTDTADITTINSGGVISNNLAGAALNQVGVTGVERMNVTTGSGNDSLFLFAGDDVVSTGAGNDTINTNAGAAVVDGGSGVDAWLANLGATTANGVVDLASTATQAFQGGSVTSIERVELTLGSGDNTVLTLTGATGAGLRDIITGGAGDDTVRVGGGSDSVNGGLGDDLLIIDYSNQTTAITSINSGGIIGNQLSGAALTQVGISNIERINITTGAGNDQLLLSTGADTASTGAGDDIINTRTGTAIVDGGSGRDTWVADFSATTVGGTLNLAAAGPRVFLGGSVVNIEALDLDLGSGDDTIITLTGLAGRGLDDTLNGGGGNDTFRVGGGVDRVNGGAGGDDRLIIDLSEAIGNFTTISSGGIISNNLAGDDEVTIFQSNFERIQIIGSAGDDNFFTGNGDDSLSGGAGADELTANGGNDKLDGGSGADTMAGGLGDDTYTIDSTADVVVENNNAGTDTIVSRVTHTLETYVENLVLTGAANNNATGNALANVLTGNSGNNSLNGLAGADTMVGGLGNDTYYVDNAGDVVIEATGEGTDTVRASVSFDGSAESAAGIENVILIGTAAINTAGNALDNTLTGNSANNSLNGGKGSDTLIGGLGNDTYTIDSTGDVIVELTNQGSDVVRSAVSFTLSENLENLTLVSTRAINGIGNEGVNVIVGGEGDNILAGKGGADILTGGAGSDTFDYNTVTESSFTEYDRITDLTNLDKIDLSGIDADTGVAGNQAFVKVNAFTHHAGEITMAYNAGADFTVLSADVNGDGVADMRIVINGDHHDFTNFVF